jgi:integrase
VHGYSRQVETAGVRSCRSTYHNWLNRTLKPVSKRLGIRANHQILRRTFATLAYNSGGDIKDIQAQMRHASVNATATVYTKPIPQNVRNTVEPRGKSDKSFVLNGGRDRTRTCDLLRVKRGVHSTLLIVLAV